MYLVHLYPVPLFLVPLFLVAQDVIVQADSEERGCRLVGDVGVVISHVAFSQTDFKGRVVCPLYPNLQRSLNLSVVGDDHHQWIEYIGCDAHASKIPEELSEFRLVFH